MGDILKIDQLSNSPTHVDGFTAAVPLMTREKFAQTIGLELGVLIGQCEKGYWPQMHIGKRVFINVALLHQQCLNKAFK